ncbi:hypothetical protein EV363DRAFT_1155304 [Boletus edulis]|nr:hypothetical protein EV363DRAFT_1155304 [Boletus edulis]
MSSPPPLLGPSILRHLRTSLLVTPIYHLRTDFVPFSSDLVDYLWTSVHQPQSLRISAGVRQGEIWSLTASDSHSQISWNGLIPQEQHLRYLHVVAGKCITSSS